MKIAFAGLGVMGAPMARHLVEAGHDVTGFNRTVAKAQAWAAAMGGKAAATVAEAARGVDLFDLQQLNLMLEINAIVLCGRDPARRLEYAQHLAATEEHFFNNVEGGIKDLYNWYCKHHSESVWKRAAGVYVRILSKPQLFIEGNNRSGSLIVSYLLMRDGLPPFVLSLENAEGYFNPSSVIRNSAKHGVKALYELPKIKKKYAAFLEDQSPEPKQFFLKDKPMPISQGGR